MKDRVDELRRGYSNRPVAEQPVHTGDSAGEVGPPANAAPNPSAQLMKLPEFWDAAQNMALDYHKIEERMREVKVLNKKAHQSLGEGHMSAVDEGRARMEQIENLIGKLRGQLSTLEQENTQLAAHREQAAHSYKMRLVKTASLHKKFAHLISSFRTIQEANRKEYLQELRRQYVIVHPQATNLELSAFINNEPGARQTLFADTIKADDRRQCEQMQARLKEMRGLEASIQDLAKMHQEMADQVMQQQAMLDSVEDMLKNVEVDTEDATGHLESAKKALKRRQKRKIILIVAIVVVVLILLVSILAKVAPVLLLMRPQTRVNVINKK